MSQENFDLFSLTANKGQTGSMGEFSVTEISNRLKKLVEENFEYIKVRGEISGMKFAPSGHLYFSLKDANNVLSAVCWRNAISGLKSQPKEGLEVVCSGNITTYGGQSKYQMVVTNIELHGVGALMALLEKKKQEFKALGYFDENRKKKRPFMPKIIGVVTSPTGSVIRDILHRINERFPTRIIVWPVLVQGPSAAGQIAAAIDGFNSFKKNGSPVPRPDVIIVARGGGSIEDLWPFNEDIVVKSVYQSEIPIISAVGHETDTTLIDYVADLRAPTPTAAAEMAVPVRLELVSYLSEIAVRKQRSLINQLNIKSTELIAITRALPNLQNIILNYEQKLDELTIRLQEAGNRYFYFQQQKLLATIPSSVILNLINSSSGHLSQLWQILYNHLAANIYKKSSEFNALVDLLASYDYKNTMKRGFAMIRNYDNRIIKTIASLEDGQEYLVELVDGVKKINVNKKI